MSTDEDVSPPVTPDMPVTLPPGRYQLGTFKIPPGSAVLAIAKPTLVIACAPALEQRPSPVFDGRTGRRTMVPTAEVSWLLLLAEQAPDDAEVDT